MTATTRPVTLRSLSRDLVERQALAGGVVTLPSAELLRLPERAMQFGTGVFLRGFVGSILDDANRRGLFRGRVVAVSSTGSGRDDALNGQDGLYTLAVRGRDHGAARDDMRVIASTSRALSATRDWDAVLACARDPNISLVFSNTTEVGITLDEVDAVSPAARRSFPAKLTAFLLERARHFDYDASRAPLMLPCELIEGNGDRLRDIVRTLASRWHAERRFFAWIDEVRFCNTLVDRIVTAPSADAAPFDQALGYRDALLTCTEPYRLFAIEGDDDLRARLPIAGTEGVLVAPDITPYRLRKVRLLNGSHTLCAPLGLLAGCETVADAMADPQIGAFQRRILFDEIVPVLAVPGAAEFARDVLDRFQNPVMRHSLWDITLQGTAKMAVRVVPTILAHVARRQRVPQGLAFGFAMHLLFMRGDLQDARRRGGASVPADANGERVRGAWSGVRHPSEAELRHFVHHVCADRSLWGDDPALEALPGFVDAVATHLWRASTQGVQAALAALLGDQPSVGAEGPTG